jgi:epoxyqueuosine reductase
MAASRDALVSPAERAHLVKERALALGFASVGITHLDPSTHGPALRRWLEAGMAGTMRYMHRQAPQRLEPARIVPGATRAVVVTRNHFTPDPGARAGTGRVARYARGRDYHRALREPLRDLAAFIRQLGPPGTVARAYCDAGPVPERELAQRAGLGWIGKNTMLIDPARGSYLFLAVVLTNLEMELDLPFEADRCGSCRRCLDACPTQALVAPRVLDSRRCISYLTIEYRGPLESGAVPSWEDWIFGCDICQEVCPWNVKFARAHQDQVLGHDPEMARLDLIELAQMPEAEFRRRFGETALERAGPSGMRRNARLLLERRGEHVSPGRSGR